MFAASKSGSVDAKDANFKNVTMLLHGNGTNGAQNNTFVDSSTNNFSITRNGNTTQGTFSPYGSNWSNNFNGSTGYLTVPSSSLFKPASSNFTIEAWVFVANTGVQQQVYGDCDSGTNNGICLLAVSSALKVQVDYFTSSTAVVTKTTTGSIQANAWNHICVSKTGTTMYIGYNGTLETFTGIPSTMQSPATIYPTIARLGAYNGLYVNGYISNFRYVIGSAVYTGSTYTVPTSLLTAISGTSILTCADNRFIDDSTNALTITRNGDVSVQRFSPFSPTSAYSTSVIGGSGYFDGNGDYLNTTSTQVIPTGSFTVEAWVYPTSSADSYFIAQGTTGNVGRFSIGITSGSWYVQIGSTSVNTGSVVLNQWTYVAATFNGTTLTLYVNGTSVGTGSTTTNAQNTTLRVGSLGPSDWGTYYWTGYIGPVRISNSVRTISAPTTPYSSDGNTTCLLSYTNAGILDNAMMSDLETVGNAQISTSVKKFGTGSIAFDGSGDRLNAISSPNYGYSTGDFTIEFWAYPTSASGVQVLIDQRTGSSTSAVPTIYTSSGTIYYYVSGNNRITGSSLSLNQWSHIAICRSGTSTKLFINGTQSGSTYTDTTTYLNAPVRIGDGNDGAGPYPYSGYIDDLRITKGFARYTANFTAPTAAFADKG